MKSSFGLPAWLAHPTIIDPERRLSMDDTSLGLNEFLQKRCKELGYTEAFAVQAAVIPRLLSLPLPSRGLSTPGDVCVSAPTGSGKTLAYALPIVQTLMDRRVRRTRALILLPTRELVGQVRETMDLLTRGTDLLCVSITGQSSFQEEQRMLVDPPSPDLFPLAGGSTRPDILIATPGRLMDHLSGTPHFSLEHLTFLVVDEADRLLHQSFQGWLPTLLAHLAGTTPGSKEQVTMYAPDQPDATARVSWPRGPWVGPVGGGRAQKLLFSATLTRNPEKITGLYLHQPSYLAIKANSSQEVEELASYSVPEGLSEAMTVCEVEEKPLAALHLLYGREAGLERILCFCSTVESASRLTTLLKAFHARWSSSGTKDTGKIRHFSSDLSVSFRSHILSQFRHGHIRLLVCSDLAARGLDVEGVDAVVNYDVPTSFAGYIHRVGRTARAGRSGK
ncbi:MAG: P-loop containing nucleoside triphosphate hydrolase protein, partial [Piptocephalis tieghemiana]